MKISIYIISFANFAYGATDSFVGAGDLLDQCSDSNLSGNLLDYGCWCRLDTVNLIPRHGGLPLDEGDAACRQLTKCLRCNKCDEDAEYIAGYDVGSCDGIACEEGNSCCQCYANFAQDIHAWISMPQNDFEPDFASVSEDKCYKSSGGPTGGVCPPALAVENVLQMEAGGPFDAKSYSYVFEDDNSPFTGGFVEKNIEKLGSTSYNNFPYNGGTNINHNSGIYNWVSDVPNFPSEPIGSVRYVKGNGWQNFGWHGQTWTASEGIVVSFWIRFMNRQPHSSEKHSQYGIRVRSDYWKDWTDDMVFQEWKWVSIHAKPSTGNGYILMIFDTLSEDLEFEFSNFHYAVMSGTDGRNVKKVPNAN